MIKSGPSRGWCDVIVLAWSDMENDGNLFLKSRQILSIGFVIDWEGGEWLKMKVAPTS